MPDLFQSLHILDQPETSRICVSQRRSIVYHVSFFAYKTAALGLHFEEYNQQN